MPTKKGRNKNTAPLNRGGFIEAQRRLNQALGIEPEQVDLDLHGERQATAQQLLEVTLRRAIASRQPAVLVNHGSGTGALRNLVHKEAAGLVKRICGVTTNGLPVVTCSCELVIGNSGHTIIRLVYDDSKTA